MYGQNVTPENVPKSGREAYVSSLTHLQYEGRVYSHLFSRDQGVTALACCCPVRTGVCLQKITSRIFWKDGSVGKNPVLHRSDTLLSSLDPTGELSG